jgi:hypothetical protein
MVRVSDEAGAQMVIACVPGSAKDLVCIGQDDSWTANCKPVTSVIFDVSVAVQLTNHRDVAALSGWLSAAAVWLKSRQKLEREEVGDERSDF